jgi:citrate lyase beta subunit
MDKENLSKASSLKDTLDKLTQWQKLSLGGDQSSHLHPAWDHPHPLHTVYGGAHLFKATTIPKLSQLAHKTFREHCPSVEIFRQVFQLEANHKLQGPSAVQDTETSYPSSVFDQVYSRLRQKLATQAIEDYRIDFEDGLGLITDHDEDTLAQKTAQELMIAAKTQSLSPLIGIRIKSFASPSSTSRAIRTLETFFAAAITSDPSIFPQTFIVTLPKVENPLQVRLFVELLQDIRRRYPLEHAKIYGEIMIESAQALSRGSLGIRELINEDNGSLLGVHFGAHDYLASLRAAGVKPHLRHPMCDDARILLKKSLSHTPLAVVDGAETFLPIGPTQVIHHAWRLSFTNVWNGLDQGIFQGWDLHPAQIPPRYAAVFLYFLSGLSNASGRLKNFVDGLTQAARVGAHFDDLATAQGLLNFFDQALRCGAITSQELGELNIDFGQVRSHIRSLPRRNEAKAPSTPPQGQWTERD